MVALIAALAVGAPLGADWYAQREAESRARHVGRFYLGQLVFVAIEQNQLRHDGALTVPVDRFAMLPNGDLVVYHQVDFWWRHRCVIGYVPARAATPAEPVHLYVDPRPCRPADLQAPPTGTRYYPPR